MAHGLVLLDWSVQGPARARALAALAEVDISVYDRATYGGFGGPLPLFTASVPQEHLNGFSAYVAGRGPCERVSGGNRPDSAPPTTPLGEGERMIPFVGTLGKLLKQHVEQALSQFEGGVPDGLLFRGSLDRPLTALTFDGAPHPPTSHGCSTCCAGRG